MKKLLHLSMVLFAALLGSSLLQASPQKPPDWAPIPIAPTWTLEKSKEVKYDSLQLPLGSIDSKENTFKPAETLEGHVWVGRFSPGENGSVLKEQREIEQALEKAGFQRIWECADSACSADKREQMGPQIILQPSWGQLFFNYSKNRPIWLASWKATLKVKGEQKGFGLVSVVGYTNGLKTPAITFFVVETKPFEATAKLDASSIGQALIEQGKVTLPIQFDLDQRTVRPEGLRLLADVDEALRKNHALKIRIEGHTDAQGTAEHNQQLSLARAEAVKTILVMGGIEAARLTTEGFGSSKLLAKGNTENDHAKNRRVELVVVQ